jgi:hypothetical protein
MFKNKLELKAMIQEGIGKIMDSGMLQDYLSFLAKMHRGGTHL